MVSRKVFGEKIDLSKECHKHYLNAMLNIIVKEIFVALILVMHTTIALCSDDAMAIAELAYRNKQYTQAYELWLSESIKGNPHAQGNLAILYREGKGVNQDELESLKWSISAANGGSAEGQYDLATEYLKGVHLAKNISLAFDWMKKAADQGFNIAQYHLGTLYFEGLVTNKDTNQAYFWFLLAASSGYPDAQQMVEISQKILAPEVMNQINSNAEITLKSMIKYKSNPVPNCYSEFGPYADIDIATEKVKRMKIVQADGTIWARYYDGKPAFIVKVGAYESYTRAKRNASYLSQLLLNKYSISCNGSMNEEDESVQSDSSSALPAFPLSRNSGSCPSGYRTESSFCMPRVGARYAIQKYQGDSCPNGYSVSGDFCLAINENSRMAIKRISVCPSGYSASNSYCIKQ